MDDRKIILHPTSIGRLRDRGWMDVVAQTAATKVDVEEMAPMVVVVGSEIKGDWDEGCIGGG